MSWLWPTLAALGALALIAAARVRHVRRTRAATRAARDRVPTTPDLEVEVFLRQLETSTGLKLDPWQRELLRHALPGRLVTPPPGLYRPRDVYRPLDARTRHHDRIGHDWYGDALGQSLRRSPDPRRAPKPSRPTARSTHRVFVDEVEFHHVDTSTALSRTGDDGIGPVLIESTNQATTPGTAGAGPSCTDSGSGAGSVDCGA